MSNSISARISVFLNEILLQYGLSQSELAEMLGVGLASLSAYIQAKELPRVDVLIKLADMGGVSLDELLRGSNPPEPKKETISITINGKGANVGGGVVHGDVYQNTYVRKVHKYQFQEGDLTEQQASKLQQLVNEIVELESTVKKKPASHAAVWNSLRRKFKVGYYRKICQDDFPKAESYLKMWKGRLTRPLARKDEDEYRKKRYAAIFAAAKNNLGLQKKDVDDYLYAEFQVESIRDLSNKQLESLYTKVMSMKRKVKRATI